MTDQQMLPTVDAMREAHMAWVEAVIDGHRVFRIPGGEEDAANRWSATVWAEHDLIGAMMAFRGAELFTTYILGARDIVASCPVLGGR